MVLHSIAGWQSLAWQCQGTLLFRLFIVYNLKLSNKHIIIIARDLFFSIRAKKKKERERNRTNDTYLFHNNKKRYK